MVVGIRDYTCLAGKCDNNYRHLTGPKWMDLILADLILAHLRHEEIETLCLSVVVVHFFG